MWLRGKDGRLMSAIPSYTVICDGPICDSDTPNSDLGNMTAAAARREAARQGWKTGEGGTDWCPGCQEDGAMRAELIRHRAAKKAGIKRLPRRR